MIDDVPGDPKHPLRDLSIRELILELAAVEELAARHAVTADGTYAARFITQREQQIVVELRNRAACLPSSEAHDATPHTCEKAGEWES
ncbi:hypothetical protein GCM10027414_27670 [Humibacter ginsengiterrae]